MWSHAMRVIAAALILSWMAVAPAAATSGWGCYRPNVGPSDPLNVRAQPSASSAIVADLDSSTPYIIAYDAPGLAQAELFEVHRAEQRDCTPANLPLGARWCPVQLYGGEQTLAGWVKRRFVDHSECP